MKRISDSRNKDRASSVRVLVRVPAKTLLRFDESRRKLYFYLSSYWGGTPTYEPSFLVVVLFEKIPVTNWPKHPNQATTYKRTTKWRALIMWSLGFDRATGMPPGRPDLCLFAYAPILLKRQTASAPY